MQNSDLGAAHRLESGLFFCLISQLELTTRKRSKQLWPEVFTSKGESRKTNQEN